MIDFKNRYSARKIGTKFGVYDKRVKSIVWYTKSKEENESVCKNLNNGSGFQGEIPNFFNENKYLTKGLTT